MARVLTLMCAAVPALGLSGCDPDFCDAESKIVRYEWDVDAFPFDFELDAGSEPVIERQAFLLGLAGPEERIIRLRVTDQGDNTDNAARTITITTADFTAAFTVSPGAPFVGNTVTFDGSGSVGARFFSWDLDGNGSFETGPSESPTVTHVYQTPGERLVKLRVADSIGRTTDAQRAINVRASRIATTAAKRRGFAARLTRVRLPETLSTPTVRGGVTALRGLEARGRLVTPGRRLEPLRPFRRARWVARLTLTAESGDSRVRGVALARFPRGRGKACLRIAMATRDRGRPAGRVTVLGGTGKAARLRGGGRFTFAFEGDTPRLNGRLRARPGKARPLPRTCAGL